MKLMKTQDAVGQVLCHDITQIIKGVTKDAVFRKGHVITEEDIDAVCITQVTNKIFDMIAAIANRQTRKAMDLYEDLLTLKEPSMRILFLIARQFNQILSLIHI